MTHRAIERKRFCRAYSTIHAAILISLSVILLGPSLLLAQIGGTGTIQGTVKDPSGAVLSGATVTATDTSTGVKTVQQTTKAGFYSIAALPAGEYTVAASASGFQSLIHEHVIVDALAIVSVDLSLKLGAVGTSVVVSAAPPMLETSDATLGESMRSSLYTALPLAMNASPRDPTAFVALVPGVTNFATQGAGTSYASFNGGQEYQNEVYIEGLPLTDGPVQGETRFLSLSISVEAVDQFQVETNDPPAMYEGQGVENYVLKSGTNSFHGSAYEYFRNTVLDAAGYFSPTTPVEQQNEFGVQAGGPIKKDKIFFFADYDGYIYREATTPTYQTVPTIPERGGDFSQFPQTIYDPNTTTCNAAGTSCSRQPFANNMIPANRLSSVSQSLASYLATPTNSGIQNNLLTAIPVGLRVDNTTDRIDAHLSDKHLIYGFFSHGQYTTVGLAAISAGTNATPLPYTASRIVDEVPTTIQIHDVYSFTPRLLNQFGYNFNRLWVPIISATQSGDYPQKAGLAGLPAGQADEAFPTVNFSGTNSPVSWAGTNSIANDTAFNTYVAQDNVQWVRNKHSITMGGQVEWLQSNQDSPLTGSDATFNISNNETTGFTSAGVLSTANGNPFASYLLGAIDSAGVTQNAVATVGGRWRNYALYIQDDFRASSKLTLNMGLRYDTMGVFHEVLNRMSFLNPTAPNPAVDGYPGALEFSGNGPDSCNCSSEIKTHHFNFGPRLGVAYAVDPKTVIRAGFAIMYVRAGAVGGRNYTGTGQLGFDSSPSFVSTGNGAPAFFWNANPGAPPVYASLYQGGVPPYTPPPFFESTLNTGYYTGQPIAGPGSITYGDPNIGGRPPYYENVNFGVERALTPNMTVSLAYSGSFSHYLSDTLGRPGISTQINPEYLALGTLLSAPANAANIAAANAIVPGVALPYANYSGPLGQMLVPFPQYSSVTDTYEMIGSSNYNSLIATLRKQLSSGLVFNFSYVRSKELDNIVTTNARTAYNHRLEYSNGTIDSPNGVSANFSYNLPFGQGHRIGGGNPIVARVVGNWQLSGIYTFHSQPPIQITSSACNAPYTGGECLPNYNPSFTGPILMNGGPARPKGNVLATSYINVNAFSNPAPYTFGNLAREAPYGLRSPAVWDQDLTVRRQFGILGIPDRYKLIFAVSAFNVFNTVNFGGVQANIDNPDLGSVTTQANSARKLQLDARITF